MFLDSLFFPANGASTNYIVDSLGVPVACVATGVKHLHHAAEQFDIGVYFEANGHGTVLLNPSGLHKIHAALAALTSLELERTTTTSPSSPVCDQLAQQQQVLALRLLLALPSLVNQAVGDALSDALLVAAILAARRWSLADWNAIYTDLPSCQTKVLVADRY